MCGKVYNRSMSKKKTHQEFMAQVAHRLDEYEVLSEYKTANDKMLFRHKKCGSEFLMKPMHFVYGEGCRECSYKKRGEAITKTRAEFLKSLPSKYAGWSFSGYSGATSPITATCPNCGRVHTYSSAKSFVVGDAGCKTCENRQDGKELARTLADLGWELIERLPSRWTGSGRYLVQQLKVRCKKCGNEKITSVSNLRKYRCEKCSGNYHGVSKEETRIYEWVKSICPDAVQSDRSVLKALGKRGEQLDILIPSKNVAIEYNGRYYHSTKWLTREDPDTGEPRMTYAEAKRYHYMKSLECERQGIRLIHIWDYEWADERKRAVLKNIILGALGMLPERYYARDCEVHRYDINTPEWSRLNQFFKDNNIQGNRGGTFAYTLEKDGRILMGYKFGRPSNGKAKKLYQYEMARGAAAPGVQVVGGATRLWSHFVKDVKPKSLVYYVDYNYFDGRSVEKLGGKYLGSTPGVRNYWVKEKEIKNREPAHHAKVKAAIARGEVLELWNAGTKTYAFYW